MIARCRAAQSGVCEARDGGRNVSWGDGRCQLRVVEWRASQREQNGLSASA